MHLLDYVVAMPPGLAGRSVYLDMQATTPIDPRVLDAMMPFLLEKFGNASSRTHAYGWEAEKAVETAREQVPPRTQSELARLVIYFEPGIHPLPLEEESVVFCV
jgi:hypothetical protein